MRFLALAFVFIVTIPPAAAFDIKLDESWLPKLAQLCDAARYAARMTAEPICNDLGALVQKAQADEAAAKAKEAPKDAPQK